MVKLVSPMTLIFTALLLLAIPGILYNNLNSNGLAISGSQSPTTCDINLEICTYPTTVTNLNGTTGVGCAAAASVCGLQGASIQLLNACSPFTNILTFNYVGFVSSFFTSCGQGSQQVAIAATAQYLNSILPTAGTNVTFSTCDQTGFYGLYYNDSFFECHVATPSLNSAISFPLSLYCTTFKGHFSTAASHYLVTCLISSADNPPYEITASCYEYGSGAVPVYGAYFPPPGPPTSVSCAGIAPNSGFYNPANAVQPSSNLLSVNTLLSIAFTLIGVTLLLLVGLGIGISWGGSILGSGVQGSITSNEQGSKMAQAFGIGLVIWGPLYSEFSTWFSSGLLPYGLDGGAGLVGLFLIGTFFFGIWWRSQSLE